MISERDIADKFSVIWKQHFPLLTPNFMRLFNETQVKKINSLSIPISEAVRYDLVSEAAFNLAELSTTKKDAPKEYLSDKTKLDQLIKATTQVIWKSRDDSDEDINLNELEIAEIRKICENITEFIDRVRKKLFQFKPRLIGYGFIPDLIGDLSIDDTLYEIKTVNRNFQSSDIRQLFIYLALKQVHGSDMWKYAGLYNPRRGTYCKFNVKSLIYNLTGGKSPNEAFENLLTSLVRDIQIDSRF